VFEYSIRDFFETQNADFGGRPLGLHVVFRASAFEYSVHNFLRVRLSNCVPSLLLVDILGEFRLMAL
jgi:hypothetical protein